MQSKETKIQAKAVVLALCDPLNNQFKWTLKSTMRKNLIETVTKMPDVDSI